MARDGLKSPPHGLESGKIHQKPQKVVFYYSVTLWIGSISTRGSVYIGLVHARPKRKILAEFGQCTSVLRSRDPTLANFLIGERVPKDTEPYKA